MKAITMTGVTKRLGRSSVLDGLSFAVAPGEVVALVGDNGVGKTTTLHLLLGLLEVDGGDLEVAGVDPILRSHLREVGWVSERPGFPSRARLRDLLRLQASLFPEWDQDLAADWVDRLDLDPSRRVDRLSRGGEARVALLLALAHRPSILLLDEPTLGLDPATRRLLLGEVLGSAAETGAAVLVATHLVAEVERALDRLVILDGGRAVVDASVEELRSRHRRLRLPPLATKDEAGAAELPWVDTPVGRITTDWNESAWRGLLRRHPGAEATPLPLEDLVVSRLGRIDSNRTDSNRTDSNRTDSDRTDSDRIDASQTDSPDTDKVQRGAA